MKTTRSTRGRKKKEEDTGLAAMNVDTNKDTKKSEKKELPLREKSTRKGKKKVISDDEGEEDGENTEVIEKKLKQTKKKAKLDGADPAPSNIQVDFSVFNRSLVDVLRIPNIEQIERDDFEGQFDRIADQLLNHSVFFISNIPHRLTEIEFYCNGHKHPDEFAHGSDLQKTRGKWYFHTVGGTYKSGTYKGLDLTFGDDNFYGGILLRALQPIGGKIVEGPSLLVDHVLSTTSSAKIEQLVPTFDLSAENIGQADKKHPMFIGVFDGELPYMGKKDIVKSGRVGLTLKRFKEGKEAYIGKHYRYMIDANAIKKGKHLTIVALHKQGKTAAEITEIAKSPAATVKKYCDAYDGGKGKDWRKYIDAALTPDDNSVLFGAIDAAI